MPSYLQITLKIENHNRAEAVKIYNKYREPFLENNEGAMTKQLLVREDDVQVLHGFNSWDDAERYLSSDMFMNQVAAELKDLLEAAPDIRIYDVVD